jgi:small subunit ribosomal protein S13
VVIYIHEKELSEDKPVFLSIADIYGLGLSTSKLISKKLGFLPNLKTKYLTQKQINLIIEAIKNLKLKLAGDLKKEHTLNIDRLIAIKSYRGLRIFEGLPVRGQRTHSNAKTARKNKRQK